MVFFPDTRGRLGGVGGGGPAVAGDWRLSITYDDLLSEAIRGQHAGAVQRIGERTFLSGAQMFAVRIPATNRCSGTSSTWPCCPEQTDKGTLAAPVLRASGEGPAKMN